jgi:hypothetical protein
MFGAIVPVVWLFYAVYIMPEGMIIYLKIDLSKLLPNSLQRRHIKNPRRKNYVRD